MAKIAFFSSHKTYEEGISPYLAELKRYAKIEMFVFDDLCDIAEYYHTVEADYDGFLFSGWLLYALVTAKYKITKPYKYFYPSEGDFFRTLLKACTENPSIPMRSIMIDRPEKGLDYEHVMPENNHCILPDLDGLDKMQFFDRDPEQVIYFFNTVAKQAYETTLNKHDVKILISGYPGMESICQTRGIRFYHLNAGKQTLIQGLKQLLNYLYSGQCSQMLSVYGIIKTSEAILDLVETKISNYILLHGFYCMIYQREGTIRLVLTAQDFSRITRNSTDCLLSQELLDQDITDFYIGWGVGYDITKAHDHAKKAMQTARHCTKGSAMIVNEVEAMIGPLRSQSILSITAGDDRLLTALSDRMDISRLNIQRIQAVIQKTNNNQFTSMELSKELNISQRNARRILTKLLDHGGAELVEPPDLLKRGRPELIYKIHLL